MMDEDFRIIQKLERLEDTAGICNRLTNDYNCMLYTKLYCIKKVFEVPVDDFGRIRFDEMNEKDRKLIDNYVSSFVSKIRLFKEGNLCLPVSYKYFKTYNGEAQLYTQQTWLNSELGLNFNLEDSELEKLTDFMKDLLIPFHFEQSFLQKAFELFEVSYYTTFSNDIKTLILFMSMEVLFKSKKNCKSNCIALNIASFLEENQSDFKNLYCEMKNDWQTRNKIAHEGSADISRQELQDLIKKLRRYVRKSIVKMDKIGQDKDKIIEPLQNKFNKVNCYQK